MSSNNSFPKFNRSFLSFWTNARLRKMMKDIRRQIRKAEAAFMENTEHDPLDFSINYHLSPYYINFFVDILSPHLTTDMRNGIEHFASRTRACEFYLHVWETSGSDALRVEVLAELLHAVENWCGSISLLDCVAEDVNFTWWLSLQVEDDDAPVNGDLSACRFFFPTYTTPEYGKFYDFVINLPWKLFSLLSEAHFQKVAKFDKYGKKRYLAWAGVSFATYDVIVTFSDCAIHFGPDDDIFPQRLRVVNICLAVEDAILLKKGRLGIVSKNILRADVTNGMPLDFGGEKYIPHFDLTQPSWRVERK